MSNKDVARVAVVTGGTTGVGAATVRLFLQRGYRVLATSIADPEDFIVKTRRENSYLEYLAIDLSDGQKSAAAIITTAVEKFGRIDVLVNCAGRVSHKQIADVTDEDWDRILATNLRAPFFLSQQAFPHLRETNGCIINVSSLNAWQPMIKNQLYDTTKAALNNLTEGLSLEFRDAGVRVNAVLPGGIKTPLVKEWLRDYLGREPTEADLKSPSIAEPEQIASVIVAIAGDDFAWVNGALIPVDGGYRF